MAANDFKYRKLNNYKYQLLQDYRFLVFIPFLTDVDTELDFIYLSVDGVIIARKGYAWDGPSGPTFDTDSFMRASLVHDVLYQLMREGFISISEREEADRLLRKICIDDGMPKWRASYVYWAVRAFGRSAAQPSER